MFDRSPRPKMVAPSASPVAKRPAAQAATFGHSASHDLAKVVRHTPSDRGVKPPNHIGLPERLKARVEALSGLAMDDVRVRYRSPEPARLGALAFAKGRDIHLGPGQEHHLPHEAWHVVQQAQGRVKSSLHAKGRSLVNEDRGLEREADDMGAMAAATTAGNQTVEAVREPKSITTTTSEAPLQAKKIFRQDGKIDDVAEDYALQQGEADVVEPADADVNTAQGVLRGALRSDQTGGGKLAFDFGFFDHAFDQEKRDVDVTMKGNDKRTVPISVPKPTTSPKRLLDMLPQAPKEGGHLERILNQADLAHESGGGPVEVGTDRLREAMSGLQYARQKNLDLASVKQTEPNIDFEAKDQGGKTHEFDHFMSPQRPALTDKHRAGNVLRSQDSTIAGKLADPYKPETVRIHANAKQKWADETYLKHTNQTKGKGVVGVWDQSSDTQDEIQELQNLTKNDAKTRVEPIDLQLDREYAREDLLARQQIAHRQKILSGK